jgi:hypothetical protein
MGEKRFDKASRNPTNLRNLPNGDLKAYLMAVAYMHITQQN